MLQKSSLENHSVQFGQHEAQTCCSLLSDVLLPTRSDHLSVFMLLLVSGATATLRHTDSPRLGHLLTPASGNSIRSTLATGRPWAADNSAFSGFDAAAFCALLGRVAGNKGCLFVACPDVVGDAQKTLALFDVWQPVIAALQLPIALVGQDGLERLDVPWQRMQALFIGGSTEWKLSQSAAVLAAEAKRRGLWLHMGRCNTRRRFEHAFELKCDSVDGSGFSRWPGRRIPMALRWLARHHGERVKKGTAEKRKREGCEVPLGRRQGEKILDLPGWVFEGGSLGPAGYRLRARYVPEPEGCPGCGRQLWSGGVHRHGTKESLLRDRAWEGKPVKISLCRRRYRCRNCKRTFLQPIPNLAAGRGMTCRFVHHLVEEAERHGIPDVAAAFGLSEKTVRRLKAGASRSPS